MEHKCVQHFSRPQMQVSKYKSLQYNINSYFLTIIFPQGGCGYFLELYSVISFSVSWLVRSFQSFSVGIIKSWKVWNLASSIYPARASWHIGLLQLNVRPGKLECLIIILILGGMHWLCCTEFIHWDIRLVSVLLPAHGRVLIWVCMQELDIRFVIFWLNFCKMLFSCLLIITEKALKFVHFGTVLFLIMWLMKVFRPWGRQHFSQGFKLVNILEWFVEYDFYCYYLSQFCMQCCLM